MEIISAKYVLTMNNSDEPLENGAIAVELGKIEAVGPSEELKKAYPSAQTFEYPEHVLMPGLINAHCYLDLTYFYERNRAIISEQPKTADYIEWLIGMMDYRRKASTTEIIDAVQKGAGQAIDSGTTCLGDTTTFEGTFKILEEIGVRAIVFSEMYSSRSFAAQDLFENSLALAEKYFSPTGDSKINAGLAPSSAYLLSKNLLRIVTQHVQEGSIPTKIHAAESFPEMEFFFDSKGVIGEKLFPTLGWGEELPPSHQKTPLGYLAEIGFLNCSPAIIGGVHLCEKDLHLLARHMCRVIYCPTNNIYFNHGTLPIEKLKKTGIPIGMGTGAPHKPQAYSMWDEMRAALDITGGTPTPKEIIQMATIGSARSLGVEAKTGALTTGRMADYIIVDTPPGAEIDTSYIYGALIRNTHHFNVRKTVVGGDVLKSI